MITFTQHSQMVAGEGAARKIGQICDKENWNHRVGVVLPEFIRLDDTHESILENLVDAGNFSFIFP